MTSKSFKSALDIIAVLAFISPFAGAQKIETINGVRIVHNEKGGIWGANPRVKLELVRTIGGLETEEALSFRDPSDIIQDSVGNIYILDSGNSRIQKLDARGKFIKTIGRRGQGPGELEEAFSMDIDEKDNLYVLGGLRVEVFSAEGKPLRTIKNFPVTACLIRILGADRIARGGTQHPGTVSGRKKLHELLEEVNQNGKILSVFGEATDYGDRMTSSFANMFKFDTDLKNNICVTFWQQNRIEKYSPDGKLLWRADRALNFKTDVIKKSTRNRRGIQPPEMNEVSSDIAADGKRRIWVVTYNRQLTRGERSSVGAVISTSAGGAFRTKTIEPMIVKGDVYKLEIFDPEGTLLGEIPLSHHAHGIRIFGDNLFIRENSNAIFYQYKISEK